LAVAASVACPGHCNPGGPVIVILGSGMPTHGLLSTLIAKLQIDFSIRSVFAVGILTVQKAFEIAALADFLFCC